jgi:ABC-2 type transport system permease protein
VTRTWRKLRALGDANFALWVEYRAELFLWVLAGSLPLILMGVWGEVSKNGAFPLARGEFIRYFLAVFLARQLTFVWVIWEFEELVVTGRLSPLLLQPLNPVWRFVVAHLTERVARLPFALVIVLFGFALYPDAFFVPSIVDVLGFALALTVAFWVRFLLQYAFSMLTFWSERASAIEDLWFGMHLFLSGLIAPLDVYPPLVREIAELTPFPYLIYFPARMLLGQPPPLGQAGAVLAAWGGASFVLYWYLWRRGLRHYSAMGA